MKLKAPRGRVIVSVDVEMKNWHQFASGQKIRIERKYNNLNRRETEPVNATVIDAEGIPEGSEILIHHNALHPTYLINNYQKLSGATEASDIRHFSIDEDRCFIWRESGGEWKPLPGYEIALRIFEPYTGFLVGIEPKLIPNVLFVTTGELCGKVIHTLISVDYELIYQGDDNREARVIRCRHYPGEELMEREEITAINNDLTQKVHSGELLVGLSPTTCKVWNEENVYS